MVTTLRLETSIFSKSGSGMSLVWLGIPPPTSWRGNMPECALAYIFKPP